MPPTAADTAQRLELVIAALRAKQGRDLAVFDVRNFSALADYFVLVTALSPPHLKALWNAVHLALKAPGFAVGRCSGAAESGWMVSDYTDVIVHFFLPDLRAFYDLETLWKKMPRLALPPE